MARALTRSERRRSKTHNPLERELKRLRLSVCDDVGFRLYLATFDQPKRRDELIARVIKEAEAEKVRVTRLDITQAGPESNLVGLLRAHLKKADPPPGWRQAVMVVGIEQRLDYSAGREGFAFLHQANLLRDALPDAAPVPVILWLSRLASASLSAEAPDLWHWRAANFDFTGDLAPRVELLRELTTLQPEEEDGLSAEQRQARVEMLEDLLAELEREGPPKSKRQSTERADILLHLGIEELHLQRYAEAIRRFEQVLSMYRRIGERAREWGALEILGHCWRTVGEAKKAIGCHENALAIAREIGDRQGEASAIRSLGKTYDGLGEVEKAIGYYEEVLVIAREIGDRRGEANALGHLGIAYADLGEVEKARTLLPQAKTIGEQIGDQRIVRMATQTLERLSPEKP